MNPPLTFANALVQLGLLTSQTTNFMFTSDEMTQALQTAWNDTVVFNPVWDSSLSFQTGTWQYAIPSTVTTVSGIYYERTSTDYPEEISKDLYEIVNGYIQFNVNAANWINDTYTLFVKGRYKLKTTDSLVTDEQVNYVLAKAAYILFRALLLKRTMLFLKNDTTVGDIINARRDMQADMLMFKQAILREFESY